MTHKRLPRPRDPVQLGKLIGDILTGQVADRAPERPEDAGKLRAAVELGRRGGLKGGGSQSGQNDPRTTDRASPEGRQGPLGQISDTLDRVGSRRYGMKMKFFRSGAPYKSRTGNFLLRNVVPQLLPH
jgi:hypothetical protein